MICNGRARIIRIFWLSNLATYCGGLSIGICISHKIADACTAFTFLNDWASQVRQSGEVICPLFNSTSIFPPSDQHVIPEVEYMKGNVATRRYVFDTTKISELKANVVSNSKGLHNPTRVEVVTSLIYKSNIKAKKIQSNGLVGSHVLAHTVNMRSRMGLSLPRNSIGNIVWFALVMIKDNNDISLEKLATQMREELTKFCDFASTIEGKGWLLMKQESQNNATESNNMLDTCYVVSSWCNFPVYQVHFGLGSPMWVSIAECPNTNTIVLIDSKDGQGIEAWITLEEEVMLILQEDEEFLKFPSTNPSI